MSHEGLDFTEFIRERPLSSRDVSLSKLHRNSCWTKGNATGKFRRIRLITMTFVIQSMLNSHWTPMLESFLPRNLPSKHQMLLFLIDDRLDTLRMGLGIVVLQKVAPECLLHLSSICCVFSTKNTVLTSKISNNEVDNSFDVAWRDTFRK